MKIIVNGASVEVDAPTISYEMVQRIAYNGKAIGEHAVRFHGGLDGRTGTLCPGEAVEIVDGTVFNVFATDGPPA
jgi:hypothetical protein